MMVLSKLLSELFKPDLEDMSQPPSVDDYSAPTAKQDAKIPVIWGRPVLTSPNCVWYGDVRTTAIEEETRVGWFKKQKVTVGYKYQAGLHMATSIADPSIRLLKLRVSDELAFESEEGVGWPNGREYINKPKLFGEGYGGMVGWFSFYPGGVMTPVNEYLEKRLKPCPPFRHVSHFVWEGGTTGESQYPGDYAFQLLRLPNHLDTDYFDIAGEANPVEILFELLTNADWSLGVPEELIDKATFRHYAKVLYEEGFGVSYQWSETSELQTVLDDVCRHIDGQVFQDPETGLYTMRLVRGIEYSLDPVVTLDVSNCVIQKMTRSSIEELSNEVRLTYTSLGHEEDAEGNEIDLSYEDRIVQVQDLGGFFAQGEQFIANQINFSGITTPELARTVAIRELKKTSYPLASVTIAANSIAEALKPGSYFRLNWKPEGIENMPFVVADIDYGNLADGRIVIDAVQDIFSLADSEFTEPPKNDWQPPNYLPAPITEYLVQEAPLFALRMSPDYRDDLIVPWVFAKQPNRLSKAYKISYRVGDAPFIYDREVDYDFSIVGRLDQDYWMTGAVDTSESLVISELFSEDYNWLEILNNPEGEIRYYGIGIVQVNQELMAIESAYELGEGRWATTRVWRGVLDTAVEDHPRDSVVWFLSEKMGSTVVESEDTTPHEYKLLSSTRYADLDPDDAETIQYTPCERHKLPYPVVDVTVNGEHKPTRVEGDLSVRWKWRNRENQKVILEQDKPSVTPEPGTELRVQIRNRQGELWYDRIVPPSEEGIIITQEEEKAANEDSLQRSYEIKLTSLRDDRESYSSVFKRFGRLTPSRNGYVPGYLLAREPMFYWRFEE